MTNYDVEFSEEAIADLDSSFEWGRETWGAVEAAAWYIEIRDSITKMLSTFPLSQPIALDDDEYVFEVRQMVIDRYHVIFNIENKRVTILHIRGPYIGK